MAVLLGVAFKIRQAKAAEAKRAAAIEYWVTEGPGAAAREAKAKVADAAKAKKDAAAKAAADEVAAQTEQPAPPATPVTVSGVKSQSVRLWSNFSGRLSAVEEVQLRPQVSGAEAGLQLNEQDVQELHALCGSRVFPYPPQANAVIDIALWDLAGKIAGHLGVWGNSRKDPRPPGGVGK